MTDVRQLYPVSRLKTMSDTDLDQVLRFALADRVETSITTVYAGMTRHQTVLTAQRTIDDITAEQGRRAAHRHTHH